jgi:glutaminyl-tRNA synthetase
LNSPWRDRPISESLKLFEDMRCGLIEEGKATLRMKQDMQSDNYNMYDLIAYRIKVRPELYMFQNSKGTIISYGVNPFCL